MIRMSLFAACEETRRALPAWRGPVAALPVRSSLIDGEAIVCDESSLAVFDLTLTPVPPSH
jgi:hypothetical protein